MNNMNNRNDRSECEQAMRLGAYLDGELPPAAIVELEQHLLQCPACAAELNELRRLSQVLRSAALPEMPPATLRRLHQSVDRMSASGILRLAEALAGVAAVILLVCVLGLTNLGPSAQGSSSNMPVWEMDVMAASPEPVIASEDVVASQMVEELSRKDDHE